MGFTALLQPGIRLTSHFGDFTSTGSSTLFGWALRQPGRGFGVSSVKRFSGAAVRNESGGEEKREEEKKNLLGVASASIGFNAVLLMSVTKPCGDKLRCTRGEGK